MQLFPAAAAERAVIASDDLITQVERRLAASVGASSARSLISSAVSSETIGVEELKRLADEAEQIRAYSEELERKSRQIETAAAQLEKANQRLREIDTQKDEFLSQVSHELRTPMTSIRSFSDILLTAGDLPEDKKEHFLGIIQSESLRLTRLLDGILDLNQMEAGSRSWPESLFDPESAIDQAMRSCEGLAHQAGVSLRRSGRTRKVHIRGNHDRLSQVIVNLISNAINYNTSGNPSVVVAARLRKDGIYEATVSDNGRGVPEQDRERIFEKFARGPTPSHAGAGLGLAISRQIVESLGGNLTVGTSKLGGAEFSVQLPSLAVTRA